MKSPESAISGRAVCTFFENGEIRLDGVTAVHRPEDAIRARLHRQVEIGHQLLDFAMGADEFVGHVGWVARGVTDALETIDLRKRSD